MTTTAEASAHARPKVGDLRRFWQVALALLIPAAPLAITVLRVVLPYHTTDNNTAVVAGIAAHPATQALVVWLGLFAAVTIVPAVLGVAHLARRGAPVLATLGAVSCTIGFSLLFATGVDLVASAAVADRVDQPTLVRLLDAVAADPASSVGAVAFVIGHILGVILLGAALWRARLIPAWAAIGLIISQPLHLVAAVVLSSAALDGVAWGLTTIGFAAAAITLLRTPVSAWDLPPLGRAGGGEHQ